MTDLVENELAEASVTDAAKGKIRVTVLTPGWGSSGYYSEEVVEQAANAGLIEAGTPMYLDHISGFERTDRPGRSVKDIAATFTGTSTYDKKSKRMVAEADLIPGPYREALIALQKTIGVSINGSASDIKNGVAEGRSGGIVEGVAKIDSVDFVTRAGRGGMFESLMESAIWEEGILHKVTEATASDRMEHLRDAVRSTHGGTQKSAWVRDQDAEKKVVWFDLHDYSNDGPAQTYEQRYKVGDNDVDVELTGKPAPVKAVTTYVSATRPDSTNPATKESLEGPVAKKEIEESEFTRLTESAGRVETLESERDTAIRERDELREEKARTGRLDAATALLAEKAKEAKVEFNALESRGILADLPVKEGKLDVEAFTVSVEEALKAKTPVKTGTGVTGFGATVDPGDAPVVEARTTTPWGRPISEQKGA